MLNGDQQLVWLDNDNTWVLALNANTGNTASAEQMGFDGSFAAFQLQYGNNLASYIGAYGVYSDTAGTSYSWAVLNNDGTYAVAPEPARWGSSRPERPRWSSRTASGGGCREAKRFPQGFPRRSRASRTARPKKAGAGGGKLRGRG